MILCSQKNKNHLRIMNKLWKHIILILSIAALICSCAAPRLAEMPDYSQDEIKGHYQVRENVSYGEDSLQVMDIYLSERSKELKDKNFTILFAHGGGYYLSDKKQEERYIQPYLKKGLNVINLNYRLKKGMFAATEDFAQALRYLAQNKAKYELNLDQIVLTGFSAGAHMASNIGYWLNEDEAPFDLPENIGVSAIINFSGPSHDLKKVQHIFKNSDLELMRTIAESFFPQHKQYTEIDLISILEPLYQFDHEDPPFFLWYGGKDQQIPPFTHERLLLKLRQDPTKNKIVFEQEGGHSPDEKQLSTAYTEIWKFLDKLKKS
jgi:acetyl esterase/lipase